ncbi:ferredoxin [Kitasatospora sp. NPDC051853]|uniref:ferredoxin n=1 Tax=Kitasatospora sp. NPDC051853 TaxID=3364058 RepID=UPI0037939E4A
MWRRVSNAVDRACEAIGRWLEVDLLHRSDPVGTVRPDFPEHGPWEGVAYWDPMPTARELAPNGVGSARWEQRHPFNVPGPFYTGETFCGVGSQVPEHILLTDGDTEFVYRQPDSPARLSDFLEAPEGDGAGGYAWDGDEHWTPELVRAWWRDRGQVREWLLGELAEPRGISEEWELRQFLADLDGGALEAYLRGYLYWLTEGREPALGVELPPLV